MKKLGTLRQTKQGADLSFSFMWSLRTPTVSSLIVHQFPDKSCHCRLDAAAPTAANNNLAIRLGSGHGIERGYQRGR
jgi:hypothetical protein